MADVSKIGIDGGDSFNLRDDAANAAIEVVQQGIDAIQDELDNAKVGRDGTVYDTLGDAVRNQLTITEDNSTESSSSNIEIPLLTAIYDDGVFVLQEGDLDKVKNSNGAITEQMVYVKFNRSTATSATLIYFDNTHTHELSFALATFYKPADSDQIDKKIGIDISYELGYVKLPFMLVKNIDYIPGDSIGTGSTEQEHALVPLYNVDKEDKITDVQTILVGKKVEGENAVYYLEDGYFDALRDESGSIPNQVVLVQFNFTTAGDITAIKGAESGSNYTFVPTTVTGDSTEIVGFHYEGNSSKKLPFMITYRGMALPNTQNYNLIPLFIGEGKITEDMLSSGLQDAIVLANSPAKNVSVNASATTNNVWFTVNKNDGSEIAISFVPGSKQIRISVNGTQVATFTGQ